MANSKLENAGMQRVFSLISAIGLQTLLESLRSWYSLQSTPIQLLTMVSSIVALIAVAVQSIRWVRRAIQKRTTQRWEAVARSIKDTGLLYWRKSELPSYLQAALRGRRAGGLLRRDATIPWLPQERVICVNLGKEKSILDRMEKLGPGAGYWTSDPAGLSRFYAEAFAGEEVQKDIKAWFHGNAFYEDEKEEIVNRWIALMNLDKIDTARNYFLALHDETSINVITYAATCVMNRHSLPTRDVFYEYRPRKSTLHEIRCDGIWSIAEEMPPMADTLERKSIKPIEVPSSNQTEGPWELFVIPMLSKTDKGLRPGAQGFYEIIHSTIREAGSLKTYPRENMRSIFANKGKFYMSYERRNLFRRPGFMVVNFCADAKLGIRVLNSDFIYVPPARKKLSITKESSTVLDKSYESIRRDPSEFFSRDYFRLLWAEVEKDKASTEIKRERRELPMVCPKIPGWTILYGAVFEIDAAITKKSPITDYCEKFRVSSWNQLKHLPAYAPMGDFFVSPEDRVERALNHRYTKNLEKIDYVVDSLHESIRVKANGVVESTQTWRVRPLSDGADIRLPFFCPKPGEISYCTYDTYPMDDEEIKTFFSWMDYWRGYWICPNQKNTREFRFKVITRNMKGDCFRIWYTDRAYSRLELKWQDDDLQICAVCGNVTFTPVQPIRNHFEIPKHKEVLVEPTNNAELFTKMVIWGMGRGYELRKIR